MTSGLKGMARTAAMHSSVVAAKAAATLSTVVPANAVSPHSAVVPDKRSEAARRSGAIITGRVLAKTRSSGLAPAPPRDHAVWVLAFARTTMEYVAPAFAATTLTPPA